MKGFEKMSIKDAVKAKKIQDLSCTHNTTMEIGQAICMWGVETVMGGDYPINSNYFARLAPLVKPVYGKAYFKTATIFVPYFQVCDDFEGWVGAKEITNGEASNSRWIYRRDILKLFNMAYVVTEVAAADVATGSWYDLLNKDNATTKYYAFTNTGRYFIKILNSLGYVIPQNGNVYESSNWYTGYGAEKISALPLLAFAKGYNDWMSQSQRYNNSMLTKLLTSVKKDKTYTVQGYTAYDATTHTLTEWGILTILDAIEIGYENDYFTSAWQYPNSPIGERFIPNGDTAYQSIDNTQINNSTSINRGNTNSTYEQIADYDLNVVEEEGEYYIEGDIYTPIHQRCLDWLKALDDYVRRNNYAGSRDVNQIYARFGIKPEDFKSNYAHLISTSSTPVQIGDITATAQDYVSAGNANNIELGDYAGKGIVNGGNSTKFEANDIGFLFTIGWITVAPMNVYGEDKKVKRNSPKDYYTPEFDAIGPEAISVDEVYTNPRIWSNTQPNAVFGFTEKYNSYRFGKDRITGDFRKLPLASGTYANVGTEMNAWHLGRILNSQLMSQTLVAQNPDFNLLKPTDSEYNRIFSNTSGDIDHFYITAEFDVKAYLPILSLNQVPRLGEGNTVVARNGNELN